MNLRQFIQKAIHAAIYGKDETKPTYAAVLIDDPGEIKKLEKMVRINMKKLGLRVPFMWKFPKHYHMTVKMGILPIGIQMRGDVRSELDLKVHSIGISEEALALGVEGYFSKNDIQHITLRFKERPSASNNIEDWKPLPVPFEVTGRVTQFI